MHTSNKIVLFIYGIVFSFHSWAGSMTKAPQIPETKKVPHKLVAHGQERIDNYYWLRDDSRTDPEILTWLKQWNEYTDAQLAPTKAMQDTLYQEMVDRVEKKTSSVPHKNGKYYYSVHYEKDKDYEIYKWQASLKDTPEVLLDVNVLAKGHDYYDIGYVSVNDSSMRMAYTVDTESRRNFTIYFKDLKTGRLLNDKIEHASSDILWTKDGRGLFYLKRDQQTLLADKVYLHVIGTSSDQDQLIYEQKDKSYYIGLSRSLDYEELYIDHSSTDYYYSSRLEPNAKTYQVKTLYKAEQPEENYLTKHGDSYYILSNWQAENYQVFKVAIDAVADKSKWQSVIKHRPEVFIESTLIVGDKLVLIEKENSFERLRIKALDGKSDKIVAFEEDLYSLDIGPNLDLNSRELRLSFNGFMTPTITYDINVDTLTKSVLKQRKVVGDFDRKNYHSERQFIVARDGAKVPVSIIYRKDKYQKGSGHPTLIYGYGSYGYSITPTFLSDPVSLLDRGFIYAIAHVRGSQTLGRQWYDDGRLSKKKNTFTDFIDVTKALIKMGYSDPKQVFASGGSAGGLLMGAIINMAPELFTGVGAHVPFVDVLTTMSDPSIPLTTNEYSEWGNPNNKADYEYMLSYSPYDQVGSKAYPNLLVTTGLHDSQVQYFEPAKWVAKLQELKTDNNKLLFHTNMAAGHSGGSERFARKRDKAREYAFFISLLEPKQSK